MTTQAPAESFESTLADVVGLPGWLTPAQARRLWDLARAVPPGGRIVEIGSFRGRSTIVLARAARSDVELVAIDPHGGGDRGPQEIAAVPERGAEDNRVFNENLERAGVAGAVRHVRAASQEALDDVEGTISLLFIDGAHRYGPARADIEQWGARVSPGGTMLIHDSFSAVGVTLAILRLLVASPEFRYRGRTGSLAEYRRELTTGRARTTNALRQIAQLPWFVRTEIVKVAILVRFRPLARALGHDDAIDWPH